MSKVKTPTVTLNNGTKMPILGYGTFLSKPGEIGPAVKEAIHAGYVHIDCAKVYNNEPEIGKAFSEIFKEGKVKREDLWITSKLSAMCMHPDEVIPCLKSTLKDLQLDYLDLYLIHIPVPAKEESKDKTVARRLNGYGMQDIWRQMEAANKQGLCKAIGVSNFTVLLLNDCLNYAKVPPAVNQVERHPYFSQQELLSFCKENNVHMTAYASLGAPGLERGTLLSTHLVPVLEDETIKKIADKYNKKPSQVLLRWSIESDVSVIPKSVNSERIKENIDVFDFKLTKDEVKQIDGLNKNLRSFKQEWMGVPMFF